MSDPAPDPVQFACTAQAIAWHARHAPDASAIVELGQRVSYLACARTLAGWVHYIEAAGVRPGMLVGIETGPQRLLHLMLFLACEVIGAAATAFAQTDRLDDDPVLPDCDLLLLTSPPANGTARRWLASPRQCRLRSRRKSMIGRGWNGCLRCSGSCGFPVPPGRLADKRRSRSAMKRRSAS